MYCIYFKVISFFIRKFILLPYDVAITICIFMLFSIVQLIAFLFESIAASGFLPMRGYCCLFLSTIFIKSLSSWLTHCFAQCFSWYLSAAILLVQPILRFRILVMLNGSSLLFSKLMLKLETASCYW